MVGISSCHSTIKLVILVSLLLIGCITQAWAQSVPCHSISPTDPARAGFGSAYNVVSNPQELLVDPLCLGNDVTLHVGNALSTTYTYSTAYHWNNSQWNPLTLSCTQPSGPWCVGEGTVSFTRNPANNPHYVVGYVCQNVANTWKCGCQDPQCAASYWQLQGTGRPLKTTGLKIERRLLQDKQDFGIFTSELERAFIQVAADRREIPESSCYTGAMDAAYTAGTGRFITLGLGELAANIIQASVLFLTTGSPIGDFLLKFGAEVFTSTITDTALSETLLLFTTENTVGYIAGRATDRYLVGDVAGVLTRALVEELLEDDGVDTWEFSGSNEGSPRQRSQLVPLTQIEGRLYYNPFTHYTTAVLRAICNIDGKEKEFLHIVTYEVEMQTFGPLKSAKPLLETLNVKMRQIR